MKMYTCPNCGKVNTVMFCDVCKKNIPAQFVTYGLESASRDGAVTGTDATNALLEKINVVENKNNILLAQIEKHTKVVSTIMIISVILSGLSVLMALIR